MMMMMMIHVIMIIIEMYFSPGNNLQEKKAKMAQYN